MSADQAGQALFPPIVDVHTSPAGRQKFLELGGTKTEYEKHAARANMLLTQVDAEQERKQRPMDQSRAEGGVGGTALAQAPNTPQSEEAKERQSRADLFKALGGAAAKPAQETPAQRLGDKGELIGRREWTSTDGQKKARATLVGISDDGKMAKLKLADGR